MRAEKFVNIYSALPKGRHVPVAHCVQIAIGQRTEYVGGTMAEDAETPNIFRGAVGTSSRDAARQGQDCPCFTPGTMIATGTGEVPIETLRVGDKVITRDNGLQEILWIGRRSFSGRDLARNRHLSPILIKAGALGDGLPERDMRLSPNHRVLVSSDQTALYFEEREVLASAKHLVNHRGVYLVESLGVAYIHLLFDGHQVVLSNGCWSESFQPTDRSLSAIGNAQRQEVLEIFPDIRDVLTAFAPARKVLSQAETQRLFEHS